MDTLAASVNVIVTATGWLLLFGLRNRESISSPFFLYLVFHTLIFCIRPILMNFAPEDLVWHYMRLNPSAEVRAAPFAVTALALVCFTAGYLLSQERFSFKPSVVPAPSTRAIKAVWCTLGVLAIYSAIFTGTDVILDRNLIEMDRINGVAVNVNQSGYLIDAQFMLVGLCALVAVKGRFSFISLLPAILFFSYRAAIGWGRWSIVLTALALYLIWLHTKGYRWPSARSFAVGLSFFVLFSILGDNRTAFRSWITGAPAQQVAENTLNPVLNSLVGLDFANYEYLAYILHHVPGSSGTHTMGLQYFQLFTEPIPRILWSGKPAGAPFVPFNLNDFGNFNGLTQSVVGDAWMTAGILGVVFILFGQGFLLGKLYARYRSSPQNLKTAMLYLVFAAMFVQFFRDGSIVGVAKAIGLCLSPIWFAYVIDRIWPSSSAGQIST